MTTVPPDGSLQSWTEIEAGLENAVLLLGNGLSINVWPRFAYGSLLDHATDEGLTPEDLILFDGRSNFERVLADLNTAIRVNEAVKLDAAPIYERYRSIQRALGRAIREVHVGMSQVPASTLKAIRDEMVRYEWIFTTSYDLIIYWAMACGGTWEPFVDGFKYGARLEFDPARYTVYENQVPVYFLHGALHLVVGGSGVTWKLRRRDVRTILDQFGEPIDNDPQARPLLVTEGSARDKLRAIEGNPYLSHALGQLGTIDLPVVVFGSSLSQQDQHLVDALNEHPARTVAISMLPGSERTLAPVQNDIYGRLEAERLLFFDATTHPLGASSLCCGA